jgi:hypothetical protein
MQRWTPVAIGVVFAAIIALVVMKGRSPSPGRQPSGLVSAKKAAVPSAPQGPAAPSVASANRERAGFDNLPDGAVVPELPASAPKAVSFGVILFMYQGSEGAPKDAPAREAALARARAVLPEATKDFAEAAKKGDRGSTADAGRIPRGVLEPAVEYWLFSLEKGAVYSEPLDTPRGFWVIKRIN